MENSSRDFGLYLDSLRSSRNMSREDFVEGVLSTRQFHRYLKGEANITNDKIYLLINKLELNILNVYKQFIYRDNTEYKLVKKIYGLIIKYDYKTAYTMIKKYENNIFTSKYNESYFGFCKITTLYNLKRISKEMAMNQYKKLINYPQVLDYNNINFVELVTLISLSSYELKNKNDKKIAYFLYNVLKEERLLLDNEISIILPSLIASICQSLGLLGENEKVFNLANQGIEICFSSQIMNSLPHLFFYKALSLLHLKKKQDALEVVKKVFMVLEIQNNVEKIHVFENHLKSNFGLTLKELKSIDIYNKKEKE